MRIKNYVAPSTIQGLGLFAAEDLPKDTLIWTFENAFDRGYTREEFEVLDPLVHEYFDTYGYRDKWTGLYCITADNDRFTNHADTPNTYFDDEGNWYALHDIRKGEEITADYRAFCADWEAYLPEMLKESENAKEKA